ncbi:MAG: type II CRISPR RNA-guided endonuclease Cas9 [Eubacteriales bacterium]|nr:type II CRISPR RNA-guided endonuclease Cas9 [Eubacteriales bacterium]
MEKFYLGLDIGTDSVGIACTDENYRLLRAKRRDLWAVRLFDEAQPAVNRRTKRAARRRLMRRERRIDLLQEIFAPYIGDDTFFLRLNNSPLWLEDKDEKLSGKYCLFADKNYTDKDFHREYQTIYHLRKELCDGKKKVDIRLFYLAIHHIIKYRGHFLYDGSLAEIRNISKLFAELNDACEEVFGDDAPSFDIEKAEEFKKKATEKKGLNDKCKEIIALFGVKDDLSKNIIKYIVGSKVAPKAVFGEQYADEKSFSFKEVSDEEFEGKREGFGDDFVLLEKMREIYNFVAFEKVLNGKECISEAMIDIYEKHRKDLKILKYFIKNEYGDEAYRTLFKDVDKGNNYANYIGMAKVNGKKVYVKKCVKYDDFKAFLKKLLATKPKSEIVDDYTYDYIMKELEDDRFLPKILNSDNGLFPNQINLAELDKILANLKKFYPETAEITEKIRSIFTFRIPYYVGPLNTYHSDKGGNSWMVRKEDGTILPWNFADKVNLAASNENFMRRMTNKCTYLSGEDVLPKFSILYQKYNVLNQINKLKINEIPLTVEQKQGLFNDKYLVEAKMSDRKIKDYFVEKGWLTAEEAKSAVISGKDGELTVSMSSYIRLKKILGELVDENLRMCEDIILWHTLNTDKSIVKSLILTKYGDIPAVRNNIGRLNGLTGLKDFGKFSEKFLTGINGGEDPVTGEIYTILSVLYDTNMNLNEIINDDKYGFKYAIKEHNFGISQTIEDEIEELYVSPAVKRGISQAMKMVDEYVSAIGRAPDKIFVEVTRADGTKGDAGRSVKRKDNLLKLYESVKKEGIEGYEELLKELKENETDLSLRSERLYLYYMQLGRCAYSGEPIDLAYLPGDTYDVDHILPRSYTKDDSLDNKVLVKRDKNAIKGDKYPIPYTLVTDNARKLWKVWKEKGLISDKKYKLLTRTEPLGADDYNDFINRQKVFTDQTTIAVAKILEARFKASGTKIVYSKAKNVSDFKSKFNIVKCRETNDLHHARDAYLNIVVGNVYDTRFGNVRAYFYRNEDENSFREINLKYMFTTDTPNAWKTGETAYTVIETLAKPSMAVTRYSYTNKGQFYDETVQKKGANCSAPLKGKGPLSNTEKYGGYTGLTTAYFVVAESDGKKGARMKTIEAIPVYKEYGIKSDEVKIKDYLENECGLKNVKLLVPKLKIKTLVRINGFNAWLAGMFNNYVIVHNANEWFTDKDTDDYVNGLGKLIETAKNGSVDEMEEEYVIKTNRKKEVKQVINAENNIRLYDKIVEQTSKKIYEGISGAKIIAKTIKEGRDKFVSKSVLKQARILLQMIKYLKCNAELANIAEIGGSANSGKLYTNKDITNTNFEIVHVSPCGLKTIVVKV